MKIAEILLPDNWEPENCWECPLSYIADDNESYPYQCVLDYSDGCPVTPKDTGGKVEE